MDMEHLVIMQNYLNMVVLENFWGKVWRIDSFRAATQTNSETPAGWNLLSFLRITDLVGQTPFGLLLLQLVSVVLLLKRPSML